MPNPPLQHPHLPPHPIHQHLAQPIRLPEPARPAVHYVPAHVLHVLALVVRAHFGGREGVACDHVSMQQWLEGMVSVRTCIINTSVFHACLADQAVDAEGIVLGGEGAGWGEESGEQGEEDVCGTHFSVWCVRGWRVGVFTGRLDCGKVKRGVEAVVWCL